MGNLGDDDLVRVVVGQAEREEEVLVYGPSWGGRDSFAWSLQLLLGSAGGFFSLFALG